MSSSKDTLTEFDQSDYDHTFYECDNDHPFISFITCYCPLCDKARHLADTSAELERVEEELDALKDTYLDLVIRVKDTAPELLI
jgi:transcription initiation factor IIE alpha subunit